MLPVLKTDMLLRTLCVSLDGDSGSSLISLEQQAAVGLHFDGASGVSNSAVGITTIKQLLKGTLVPVGSAGESTTEAAADGLHSPDDLADREGFDPDFLRANPDAP